MPDDLVKIYNAAKDDVAGRLHGLGERLKPLAMSALHNLSAKGPAAPAEAPTVAQGGPALAPVQTWPQWKAANGFDRLNTEGQQRAWDAYDAKVVPEIARRTGLSPARVREKFVVQFGADRPKALPQVPFAQGSAAGPAQAPVQTWPQWKAANGFDELDTEGQQQAWDTYDAKVVPEIARRTGLSLAQVREKFVAQFGGDRPKAPKVAWYDRDLFDSGRASYNSSVGGTQISLGNLVGRDTWAGALLERWGRENLNDALDARAQFNAATVDENRKSERLARELAQEYGGVDKVPMWEDAWMGAKNFMRAPIRSTVEAGASSAPMLTGYLMERAGRSLAGTGVGAVPGVALMALGKVVSVSGAAGQVGGEVGFGAYNEVKAMGPQKLARHPLFIAAKAKGETDEQAVDAVAREAMVWSTKVGLTIGAASGLVSSKLGTGQIARQAGRQAAHDFLKHAGIELGTNVAEGGVTQMAQNAAAIRAGDERSLKRGVGSAAVQEGLGSLGTAAGAKVAKGLAGRVAGGSEASVPPGDGAAPPPGVLPAPTRILPAPAGPQGPGQGLETSQGRYPATAQDVSTVVDGLKTAANRSALKRHLETAVRDGMLEDAARQQGVVGRAARALLTHISERNAPPAPAQVMFSRSGEPSSKERSASGAEHVTDAQDWAAGDTIKNASEVAPKMGFTPDREAGRVSYAEPPFRELEPQDAQVRSGAATERGVPMTHNNFGNPVAGDAQSLKNFWDWYSGDHARDLRGNDAGGHRGEHAADAAPAEVHGADRVPPPVLAGREGEADAARGDHAGRGGAVAARGAGARSAPVPGHAESAAEAVDHGENASRRTGGRDQTQSASGGLRSERRGGSLVAYSQPLEAGRAVGSVHAAGDHAGRTGGADAVHPGAVAGLEAGTAGAGDSPGYVVGQAHRGMEMGALGAGAGRNDAAAGHSVGGDSSLAQGSPPFPLRFMQSGPVDSQGRPVVFFHGTREHFSSFDTDHPGRKDQGWLGRGVYGTSDPFLASSYASIKKGDKRPRVMPLYFAVKNPFHADMALKERFGKQGSDASGIPDVEKRRQAKEEVQKQVDEFTQDLKDQGYDGVVLFDTKNQAWEIVAFDPAQVKSATGNTGAFDSANPDIRYSRASPPDRSGTHSTGNAPPREGRSVSGLTVAQVRQAIRDDIYHHEVDVYPTLADAPAHIQSQARAEGDTKVEGFFDPKTQRVALIAENIATPERAREVARHELTGHYGMEGMMEAAYGQGALDQKARQVLTAEHLGNKVLKELGQEVDRRQPKLREKDPQRRGREIIALMAERNMHHGLVRWVMDGVRLFFKKMGWHKGDVTDAQVAMLLREARAYVRQKGQRSGSGAQGMVAQPVFSRRTKLPWDFILRDGSRDWGEIPKEVEQRTDGRFPAGPITLKVGEHRGQNRGYGAAHIQASHGVELAKLKMTAEEYVDTLLNGKVDVYDVGNGRLTLRSRGTPAGTVFIQLSKDGDHYSVVTAFDPKKIEGKLVWSGRPRMTAHKERGISSENPDPQTGKPETTTTRSSTNRSANEHTENSASGGPHGFSRSNPTPKGRIADQTSPSSLSADGKEDKPEPPGGVMFSRSGGSASTSTTSLAERPPSVHARASLTRPEGAAVRAALTAQFPTAQPGQSHAVEASTEAGMRRYLVEPLGRAAGSRLPAPLRITQLRQSRAGALVAIEHYRLGNLGAVSLQGLPRKADAAQIRAFDEYFVPVPQESMPHTGHGPRPPDPVEHAKADAPPREGRSVSGVDQDTKATLAEQHLKAVLDALPKIVVRANVQRRLRQALAEGSLKALGQRQDPLGRAARQLARRMQAHQPAAASLGESESETDEGQVRWGAAAYPRMAPYAENADGKVRTPQEAIALARAHGVEIPEDVNIAFLNKWTQERADAEYGILKNKNEQLNKKQIVKWNDFCHDVTGLIPVRFNAKILSSDESILAHIAHEMYELNKLRDIFEENDWLKIGDMIRLINPVDEGGSMNNLHEQAWDEADRLIMKMRKGK